MRNKPWLILLVLVLIGSGFLRTHSAKAGTEKQVSYATPTARPDGRVVYIVQEGDTCLRIQLLTGVTIDQLRTLNRLDQECTIIPGKELLLAVITPQPTPTNNPHITPTPLLPTSTPFSGNGQVCVQLYNDVNGDATREDAELPLAGGAISITDRLGQVSKTENTTGSVDPVCIEVPEGEYNISMAIPSGYNATTTLNLQAVKVLAGDMAILEFGAQMASAAQNPAQPPDTHSSSTGNGLLLAILGGLLIMAGVGLAVYVALARRG